MIYGRKDYTATIQQGDITALCQLVAELLAAVACRETYNEAAVETFRVRFRKAMETTIPAVEPVFLVRGQDAVGAATVRAWAHLHITNGGSDIPYLLAMKHADLMEAWPVKKLADLPISKPAAEETAK